MYLEDIYYFWKMTFNFISSHDFEVIHIDRERREVWLEKNKGKSTDIIRLKQQTFDWSNHLQRDQDVVAEKVKHLTKTLMGREVNVHSIYISQFPPVDDWERDPVHIKAKKTVRMYTYFVLQREREQSLEDVYESLNIQEDPFPPEGEEEMEGQVPNLRRAVDQAIEANIKNQQAVLSHGKPILTYLFIAMNILMFVVLELNGGSQDTSTLIEYGAKFNPLIVEGEWWRIVSSMFLHIGIAHILLNMLALYYLGNAVERMFGSVRFFAIYFVSGIIGGLASFALSQNVAAGASGAIYGLFGALLFFGLIYKKLFFRTMGSSIIGILIINIVFSFAIPQVDIGAHLGGLVGGFLASSFVHFPKKRNVLSQAASFVAVLAVGGSLVWYGIGGNEDFNPHTQTVLASYYQETGQFDLAFDVANQAIKEHNSVNSVLYFIRSYGYIQQNQVKQAITDLKRSIELNPDNESAHYNLGVLYARQGEKDLAIDAVQKALEINPEAEDYQELLGELEGSG
ncbi:rhomboid family intramembrane serine protease [Pontibacillus sp. ALD_SL1]|uniref:rhomboid family intramembrane serine protease n=1 Tax=Pontibacillus sp. ALD_SL1 TaxID=2777185 RepID=UPI001A969351|nr:rhomboid family intramembrane serine protease [Pontibacillus sp. ALD_SL1]QSS98959.1 rhomboid family intramembrane serine protease [Pontibacillus sp. ALD_SL1]